MSMRSSYVVLLIAAIAGLVLLPSAVSARLLPQRELPLREGRYDVPGHAKLKLVVSVYDAKNVNAARPSTQPLQAVCQLADPDSTTPVSLTGWKLAPGTWTYRLNTGTVPNGISAAEFSNLTQKSFDAWSYATDVDNSVNFVKGANTSVNRARFDNQNLIAWGRTSGSALATTYTWFRTDTGAAVETDTIFNQKFAWEWADQSIPSLTNCAYENRYDAQNILTHELGHWLGLGDDYTTDFEHNTMFGYGSPTEVKKNTVSSGDIFTTNTLY